MRFYALHEPLDTAEHGDLRQVTHGLIETQKAWRSEATREGLAEAVAAGRKLGRRPGPPPLTQEQDELAHHLRATGVPVTEITALIGVSRSKLYRAQPPETAAPTTDEDSAP